jgi:hypothetical protein
LLGLLFDSKDGGDIFMRNVGIFSTDYTALYQKQELREAQFLLCGTSLPTFTDVYRCLWGERYPRYQLRRLSQATNMEQVSSTETLRNVGKFLPNYVAEHSGRSYNRQRENFKSINICVEQFCLLGCNSTDVSEEHVASNFRVEERAKQDTSL